MKFCDKTFVPALLAALLLLGLTGCDNPNGPGGEETCQVVFYAGDGKPAPAPQSVTKGGKALKPADPQLAGHTLLGWSLSPEKGPAWDFDTDTVEEDITLHARWTKIELETGTWLLSFDTQGGGAVESVAVKEGEKAARPADPVRAGYVFGGWHKEAACENPWDFAVDTVGAYTILYAKWTAVVLETGTWLLSFDTQGGGAVEPVAVKEGEKAARPADPVRDGHAFGGWHKEAACENPWDFAVDTVGAHTILYAKWTALNLTVTLRFDSQGGIPAPVPQTVAKGGKALKPADPQLAGYTLLGWRRSLGDGPAWDFDTDTVEEDITLHAWWTAVVLETGTWALSFDAQGGGAVESMAVKDGEKAARPADPVRDGHAFGGWHKEAACENPWDFAVDTVGAHTILYAKWTALKVTVSFDAQGGTPAPPDQTLAKGGKANQPPVSRKGFLLQGWYLSPEGGAAWDFAVDTVEEDITLHARWTELGEDQAALAFNADGGLPAPTSQSVALGGRAAKPADPLKSGFEFDGWYTEGGLSPWNFETDRVGSDTILHARWTAVYTVVFDSRNGGATSAIAVPGGMTVAEPDEPVLPNNTFGGWHSDAACAQPWDFAVDTVGGNLTLYAKWTAMVHFDANGGSPAPASQTVPSGSLIPVKPGDPAFAGKSFIGWHTSLDAGAAWNFDSDTVGGDMILYARWEFVPVTKINAPGEGTTKKPLSLGAAEIIPPNATNKTIVWTVKDPGTTGVTAISGNTFTPAAAGTLILTATIQGGRLGPSGNTVDYTEDFTIRITTVVRSVTGIRNVPTNGFTNSDVNLGGAAVIPPDAANKTIVWTVKDPGSTGVAAISGSVFRPAAAGTLVLTATVKNGVEGEPGALRDYTQDFVIEVEAPPDPAPGSVGLGDDTTIKLYANAETTPLPAAEVTRLQKNSSYSVRIDAEYTEIVWHLNGRRSTAGGSILYLDTGKAGVVKVTVEAKTKGGSSDSGTHTFRIE
jgi:uncharacterized repeat protein (TIGR02543 family)